MFYNTIVICKCIYAHAYCHSPSDDIYNSIFLKVFVHRQLYFYTKKNTYRRISDNWHNVNDVEISVYLESPFQNYFTFRLIAPNDSPCVPQIPPPPLLPYLHKVRFLAYKLSQCPYFLLQFGGIKLQQREFSRQTWFIH